MSSVYRVDVLFKELFNSVKLQRNFGLFIFFRFVKCSFLVHSVGYARCFEVFGKFVECTDTFAEAHFSPPMDAAKNMFEESVYTPKILKPLFDKNVCLM